VVIADSAKPDVPLQSRRFGTGSAELRHLSAWPRHYGVTEAVMESTAQYWKPAWMELEPHLQLHRRFAAGELMLSFNPEPEQRA